MSVLKGALRHCKVDRGPARFRRASLVRWQSVNSSVHATEPVSLNVPLHALTPPPWQHTGKRARCSVVKCVQHQRPTDRNRGLLPSRAACNSVPWDSTVMHESAARQGAPIASSIIGTPSDRESRFDMETGGQHSQRASFASRQQLQCFIQMRVEGIHSQ